MSEIAAEVCGLVASLVLLFPALRRSHFSKLVLKVKGQQETASSLDKLARGWLEFVDDEMKSWDAKDYSFLLLGLVLLIVAFSLKIYFLISE